NIISVVIFIVGALCVIMLVWGGIQYILSAGDSGKVTSAKNTILYAVIGLIVCIVAYAVVQFVLVNLGGNGSSSSENSNSNENSNEG
ncbi:pilin, partial [Candidatus Saccharibacteria bacterium]|nr:pilin [Candidatus Saccharibacteria bacterium]